MSRFVIGGISDNGSKTPMNQDSGFAATTATAIGEAAFVIICDGMGGTDAGELASVTIIDELRKWFYRKCDIGTQWLPDTYEVHTEWENILDYCNDSIREYGKVNNATLGSTIVMLLILPDHVLLMNIGDSRAYHITDSVRKISKDHSVVGEEIDSGKLTEEEAKHDSRNNMLTQCIGILNELSPNFCNLRTESGIYLIASDGFYNCLENEEIRSTLTDNSITTEARMMEALNSLVALDRSRGERDDISAIAVRFEEGQEFPDSAGTENVDSRNNKTVTKKSFPIAIFWGIITIIICTAVLISAMSLYTAGKERKVAEQMTLAAKSIIELDYEQAILKYKETIEIDSKNVNIYLCLANTYAAIGDYENAGEILEKARVSVNAENLQAVEDKDREIKQKAASKALQDDN